MSEITVSALNDPAAYPAAVIDRVCALLPESAVLTDPRERPQKLLGENPGMVMREIAEPGICCGSAGVYNVLSPEPASELGDKKAADLLASGAELLVTANPGCMMQLAASVRWAGGVLAVAHTAQVLDASISGPPVQTLTASSAP